MEITIGIGRAIIVDDDVDTLNINTTAEDISRHQDTLLEGLESRVTLDTTEGVSGLDSEAVYLNSPLLLS